MDKIRNNKEFEKLVVVYVCHLYHPIDFVHQDNLYCHHVYVFALVLGTAGGSKSPSLSLMPWSILIAVKFGEKSLKNIMK
jgi:hypothetical protein